MRKPSERQISPPKFNFSGMELGRTAKPELGILTIYTKNEFYI